MRLALALLVLVPGCYESHVRTDPSLCAPPGRHTVTQRLVAASPGCGAIGMGGTLDVSIPPREDLFLGASEVEIVETGPCSWDVHAETLIPDLSSVVDGTIETSDGTVRGTFDVEITGLPGVICTGTLVWEEVSP